MTAREKFRKGDSVICLARWSRWVLGTVTGFGHWPTFVSVRKDGRKTSSTYHMCFWRRVRASDKTKLIKAALRKAR
jgi:hypothetical protein